MKFRNTVLLIFSLIVTIISGCKKEEQSNGNDQEFKLPALKEWFESKEKSISNVTTNAYSNGKLDWDNIIYYPDAKMYAIKIILKNQEIANKYLVFELDNSGSISQANYYIVLNINNSKTINPEGILKAQLLNQKMPESFTGSFFKFALNNTVVFGKHFENGNLGNQAVKITKTRSGIANRPINGRDMFNWDEELVCGESESYYLVTYDIDTGEIYSVVYLFTVFGDCPNDGVEGGGNGGEDPGPTAEGMANAILDVWQANTFATSQNAGNTVLETTSTTRTAIYKWKCIQGTGWKVFSFEKGKHKYVNKKWLWESLEHLSLSKEGVIIGGTVEASLVYANATIGLNNSIMNIEVQIDMATTLGGTAYHRLFSMNSAKSFDVNGSPFLLPGY